MINVSGPHKVSEEMILDNQDGLPAWRITVNRAQYKWFLIWNCHDDHPNSIVIDGYHTKKDALEAKRELMANEFNVPASR